MTNRYSYPQVFRVAGASGAGSQYPPEAPGLEEFPDDWIHLSDYSGVRSDGTLWVFFNAYADLLWTLKGGRGGPIQVGTDTDWVESHSTLDTVLAKKSGGSLWAMGSNSSGQLGIGLHCIDATGVNATAYRFKISSSIESLLPRSREVGIYSSKRPNIEVQHRKVEYGGWPLSPWGSAIDGEPGSGAVVECDWRGGVAKIDVTNGGSGYTSRPTVTLKSSSGSEAENKAGAKAVVSKMSLVNVESFEPLNFGHGYTHAEAVETFTGATATGVIGGSVTSVNVTSGGSGYTFRPQVAVRSATNNPRENNAGATARVTEMALTNIASFEPILFGSGYTWAEATEQLTGATARGIIVDGAVVQWQRQSPGSNSLDILQSPSPYVFIRGDGAGAAARAIIAGTSVVAIEMVSNPECWESSPTFEITGGGGSGAAAQAASLSGSVVRWEVGSSGSSTADILDQSKLKVEITGDGHGAKAKAVLAGGSIEEIAMTENPECWETEPLIEITGGGGEDATAEVVELRGLVNDKLVLKSGGSGYTQGTPLSSDPHGPWSRWGAPTLARIFVVARPGDGDQHFVTAWGYPPDDPDGAVVAEVTLSESEIVSAERNSLLTEGSPWGSDHRIAEAGSVRPFSFDYIDNPEFHYQPYLAWASGDDYKAYILKSDGTEVELSRSESTTPSFGLKYNTFSLEDTDFGYEFCPLILIKWKDRMPENPGFSIEESIDFCVNRCVGTTAYLGIWFDFGITDIYGTVRFTPRVEPTDDSGWFVIPNSSPKNQYRTSEGSLDVKGDILGASATYVNVDGFLKRESVDYKYLERNVQQGSGKQIVIGWNPPSWYVGPPIQYNEILTPYIDLNVTDGLIHPIPTTKSYSPAPVTEPFRCTIWGSPRTWVGPSIEQTATFVFVKPCGNNVYADSGTPTEYWDGHVGVDNITMRDGGGGFKYREEPVPDVIKTNYAIDPIRVEGSFESFSITGQSCLAVGGQDLYWWGAGTANAGQYRPEGPYQTASPTKVGRGAVPTTQTEDSKVPSVEANRAYFSPPKYGNWIAQFGGASAPGGATRGWTDPSCPANDRWLPLEPSTPSYVGLGYESPPNLTFLACGDPVYSATTELVGPSKFKKVSGGCALTEDGAWLDVLSRPKGGWAKMSFVSLRTTVTSTKTTQWRETPPAHIWQSQKIDITGEATTTVYYVGSSDRKSEFELSGVTIPVPGQYFGDGWDVFDTFPCGIARTLKYSNGNQPPVLEHYDPSTIEGAAIVASGSAPTGGDVLVPLPDFSGFECVAFVPNGDSSLSLSTGSYLTWQVYVSLAGDVARIHGLDMAGGLMKVVPDISSLNGSLCLTKDGRLLNLYSAGAVPPAPVRPLRFTIDNHGKGYDSPATADVGQAVEDAKFDVTWEGKLIGVGVVDGGSGYRVPPVISGVSDATCVIVGPVSKVEVTGGGSDYRYPPEVVFSRPGIPATAKAILKDGRVESVEIEDGGRYRSAPTVSFVPVLDVDRIDVTDAGGGFSRTPSVFIGGGGGTGASATCRIWGGVKEVRVAGRGKGYKAPPSVVFVNNGEPGESPASAVAQIDSMGRVTSITVTNPGDRYTKPPDVVFVGECSAEASALAVMDYKIRDVSVDNHGHHYAVPPTVLFIGGGGGKAEAKAVLGSPGSGAAATAEINGAVVAVNVPESAKEENHDLPPIVECLRSDPAREGDRDAVIKARIAGKVTEITPASSSTADNYSEFHAPYANRMGYDERRPSGVFLVGSVVGSATRFHRGGIGHVIGVDEEGDRATMENDQYPRGGPISEVSLDSSLGSARFYHKPLAFTAGHVCVDAITCLQISGAVAELVPPDGSGRGESVSGRVMSETFSSTLWPDVVAYTGTIKSLKEKSRNEQKFTTANRWYKTDSIPSVIIEDETQSDATATLETLENDGRLFGEEPVEVQVATQDGRNTLRAYVRLEGGEPLVWSSPATATATLAPGGDSVASISVTNGAIGYSKPPKVILTGGGGEGAKAGTPVLSGSSITSIPIIDGGSGYTSAPTVWIIDSEVPADRDDAVKEKFEKNSALIVTLKDYEIEYAKFLNPRQVSLNGFAVFTPPFGTQVGGYQFHPLYDSTGYVEALWARSYDAGSYPIGRLMDIYGFYSYPPNADPQVVIKETGAVEIVAEATAEAYKYTDVYGDSVNAVPESPDREHYQ